MEGRSFPINLHDSPRKMQDSCSRFPWLQSAITYRESFFRRSYFSPTMIPRLAHGASVFGFPEAEPETVTGFQLAVCQYVALVP